MALSLVRPYRVDGRIRGRFCKPNADKKKRAASQSACRPQQRRCLAAECRDGILELFYFAAQVLLGLTESLLKSTKHLVLFAVGKSKVVVGQLCVLLLHLSL